MSLWLPSATKLDRASGWNSGKDRRVQVHSVLNFNGIERLAHKVSKPAQVILAVKFGCSHPTALKLPDINRLIGRGTTDEIIGIAAVTDSFRATFFGPLGPELERNPSGLR